MARAVDLDKAIEIIEGKQKELCPVGRYGRNYVYGSDREKYDAWEEIIDALENLPTLTPPNEPLTLDELGEMSYTDWVWLEFPREKPSDNCWERGWKAYRLYSHERYGVSWIAYRRPPEGEK